MNFEQSIADTDTNRNNIDGISIADPVITGNRPSVRRKRFDQIAIFQTFHHGAS